MQLRVDFLLKLVILSLPLNLAFHFQLKFGKILINEQLHLNVLLDNFNWNGHTQGFDLKTKHSTIDY